MCSVDYDPADVYRERNITAARKPHRCGECGRTINAGEPYRRTFGVWDGSASTMRTCAGCCLGMEWLRHNCGGFMHGDIFDELRDHFDGDESGIWDGTYIPVYAEPRAHGPAAPFGGVWATAPKPAVPMWRPTRSRLWLGRVLVGMRTRWAAADPTILEAAS